MIRTIFWCLSLLMTFHQAGASAQCLQHRGPILLRPSSAPSQSPFAASRSMRPQQDKASGSREPTLPQFSIAKPPLNNLTFLATTQIALSTKEGLPVRGPQTHTIPDTDLSKPNHSETPNLAPSTYPFIGVPPSPLAFYGRNIFGEGTLFLSQQPLRNFLRWLGHPNQNFYKPF